MASRNELTFESVREFILFKGGKVTNHDLVKHFKDVLTNPETRAEARNEFKEIVNTLATIVRSDEGEKYLVLKKRYRHPDLQGSSNYSSVSSPPITPEPSIVGIPTSASSSSSASHYPFRRGSSTSTLSNYSASQDSLDHFFTPTNRQPPPYRPPPPPVSPPTILPSHSHHNYNNPNLQYNPNSPTSINIPQSSSVPTYLTGYPDQPLSPTSPLDTSPHSPFSSSSFSSSTEPPPPVPPRRKSSDKIKMDNTSNKENIIDINKRPKTIGAESPSEEISVDQDSKISVKECMQKFNRLASETALQKAHVPGSKKKSGKETPDRDEEDSVSLTSLGSKGKEWLVKACQSDYQALAKMASENHLLPRLKTALHWAAKHGNEDSVKLLAGTHKVDVNSRTGYTPLHIAMQFGHQDIYNLLVQVYGADSNLRDWSGRKPRQYLTNKDTSVSADTFRKIKARKKLAEKDLGFLRIGSLNVRVKKTTEAFSHFLGVGHSVDKLHKSWGSADNIPLDDVQKMPPPKFAPIKKRKSRRAQDFSRAASQQNLENVNGSDPPPLQNRHTIHGTAMTHSGADSDSDTAAGFGSNWQSTV